jgi:hypothetical protein
MTKFTAPGLCVALLLWPAGTPAAPRPGQDEARAMIDKAIEARGGAAAIERYKAVTAKFSATYYRNETEWKTTGTAYELAFEQSRVDWEMQSPDQNAYVVQVFDRDKGWVSMNGTLSDMTKDEVAEFREVLYASAVADLHGLTGPGFQLTPLGTSKVGDKTVVGVRVSSKGHRDISLYFDKGSGLLLKKTLRRKEAGAAAEFTEEMLYGDYRNVSGLMFPFHVSETRDGKTSFVGDWSEITVAEKLRDGILTKP